MIRSSKQHRLAVVATVVVATLAVLGLATTPAGATAVDSDTLVFVPYNGQTFTIWRNGNAATPAHFTTAQAIPGDFGGGAGGSDLFLYNPGSGADGVLHIAPNVANFTQSFRSETINGSYRPIVGDFDGNAIDDIFWYAPGTGADSIWLFKSNGTHTTKSVTVNGSYRTVSMGTDGDGYTDIIFYAPGTAADSIWRFGPNATHTTSPITINGDYQLVPGYFGQQAEGSPQRRLLFFNKAGADSIWTFDSPGNHTSVGIPNIDGDFKPIVGRFTDPDNDAVLFYRPGAASERFISFTDSGGLNQLEPLNVNGNYDTSVGDFDGNGYEDIAWSGGGKATLWKFSSGGYTQATITTSTVNTRTAVVKSYIWPY